MDYLTNYYKNLCEQLQEKLNLLEAGYQKALRSNNPEQMEKEAYRQAYRARRKDIGQSAEKGDKDWMDMYPHLRPEGQEEPDLDEKGKYARSGKLEANMKELALRAHYAQGGSSSFWSTIPAVDKFRFGVLDPMKETRGRRGDQSKPAYRRRWLSTELTPDVHDGPDPNKKASSSEVATSQQDIQQTRKPDYWFRNTMNRL